MHIRLGLKSTLDTTYVSVIISWCLIINASTTDMFVTVRLYIMKLDTHVNVVYVFTKWRFYRPPLDPSNADQDKKIITARQEDKTAQSAPSSK